MKKIWREELYKIINSYPPESSQTLISKAIIHHLNNNENLNIREISKETYTSKPTVTRFAKSLGFEGIKEFAKAIQEQDKEYYYKDETKSYLKSFEDYSLVVKNLMNEVSDQYASLINIVNFIKEKKRVFIFCSPENTSLALHFSEKLNFIGIYAKFSTNYQLFWMNVITKNDIVLFLASGLDNDTLLKIWTALENNKHRILISSELQTIKFTNPTELIKIAIKGSVMREQIKQYLFQYTLDQIYNLLVYSDEKFTQAINQDIFSTLN